MANNEDFSVLVERAMLAPGRAHMRPVVEKELLHYDIIFALDSAGLLEQLTFQGGTALRLCYGSSRFSEDLDFVGGKNFATSFLIEMKTCLEKYLGERYGLVLSIKEPKEMVKEPEYHDIKIDKWRIGIATAPARKDLPHQKIKIEVGNIPAYSRIPRAIMSHYDFLPDGYSDVLVMTETLDEIMADKLISLVNCERYVRHRDIWDLRWLKTKGAQIVPDFIKAKINDYKITDYSQRLAKLVERLDSIIMGKDFYNEMSRFIPQDVQNTTLLKESFLQYLIAEMKSLFIEVRDIL